MSEYRVTVQWSRGEAAFAAGAFDRTHTIRYEGGLELQGSSAPEYGGNPSLPNPEQHLAAAVSSCHMLTFLAVAAKRGYAIDDYRDDAYAVLGPGEDRRPVVTDVHLRPVVSFGGEKRPTPEELAKLHEVAHRNCFVAGALKARVHLEPGVRA